MEQRSKNPDQLPLPCASGCGFFGSPDTGGLCSKCFRDSLRPAEAQAQLQASAEPQAAAAAAATSKEAEDEGARRAKARGRCASCGRKVSLTGFECRCGGVFCGEHHYSDRHDCCYDYRGAGRDAISQANPAVRADKVDKF